MAKSNKYDNLGLDAGTLIRQHTYPSAYNRLARSGSDMSWLERTWRTLARYGMGALYKTGLLRRLIYANLKLGWFYEFREYWTKELGMRRIEPHDFYFLHGIYRQKFQQLEVSDNVTPAEFLRIWQQPETIYLLFAYQYKLAMQPLAAYPFARYVPTGARVCEYGCGLAPITQSLIKYYPEKRLNITAADIPLFMLHFLQWKFQKTPYVKILPLDPADSTPLQAEESFDVVTCLTVLEHLPQPLTILQHLHQKLKPGGIFIFDYIKSQGTGLDTKAGLYDRQAVLDYIREHFTVLRGSIPMEGSISQPVICRKAH